MSGSEARGPLHGLRVTDFSRILAGPYATMMLADFGADVIKIESPEGDDTRTWKPPVDAHGESTYFASVNRGKRSVALDLATASGLEAARDLAFSADVVVENFRPGVMERLGLGAQSTLASNPRAIYCSITGFGAGQGAQLAGYDLLVQAVGGLMSVTGHPDGDPTKVGVALVDVICGLNAFSGILLALREREESGAGQVVRVNLMTGLLSALVNQASGALATGIPPSRLGNAHPSIAPYELYRAADRELVIAVGNQRQFATLRAVISAAHPSAGSLLGDPRFSTNELRVLNRAELKQVIESALSTATGATWCERFTASGVPAGLVNSVLEAIRFAEELGLEPVAVVEESSGSTTIANPIHLDRGRASYLQRPPTLDSHPGATWLPTRDGEAT